VTELRHGLNDLLLRWGALRRAPFLFLALSFLTATATAQIQWSEADMRRSRQETAACEMLSTAPLSSNALVVVVREAGHQLMLLDAESLSALERCHLPHALQGTPLRSPDGRYLYAAAADGWALRLDLQNLTQVLHTRTGVQLQGLALSTDGRWLLAGHTEPHSLVLLDAQLQPVRVYETVARTGGTSSAVSGLWNSAARQSFVVAFQDLPEIWELSYNPAADPIYEGLVHDYRMGEAIASAGFLGVRRTPLQHALHIFLPDTTLRHVLAAAPQGKAIPGEAAMTSLEVINMDIRRRIASREIPGRPLGDSGVAFTAQEHEWLAFATLAEGRLVLMDATTWQVHPELLPSVRGVAAVRTHPGAPQLWLSPADSGQPSGTVVLIDKADFRVTPLLREQDASWTSVSFSAGGQRAVLAVRGAKGNVRLVDTRTLQELKRVALPHVEAVFALDGPRR
jgi:hypothetical protein